MDRIAQYHLPGLFEFYELYRVFLPLYCTHRDWFYPWCDIASLYGAPADCMWGGGRVGGGDVRPRDALALAQEYGISARLTFSNSLLQPEHLADPTCNKLCRLFAACDTPQSGVIVHSELLLDYLKRTYPSFYFVSSTTKVLTEFSQLAQETAREGFRYVVPDFPPLNEAASTARHPAPRPAGQAGISLQRVLLGRLSRPQSLLRSRQPPQLRLGHP